ncbi:MAG: outer membrane lipoprotein-sorting protein [SAR324 cluster bacterium]|nr:outer membrane lipoprotein-sorting protein [SAR324 cluster bacterium]
MSANSRSINNRSFRLLLRAGARLRAMFRAMGGLSIPALAILLAMALPLVPPVAAQTAREIMDKVNDRDDGDNQVSDLTMTLIDKNKKRRVRSIRSYSKDFGKDTYSILFFLSPADMKNTGFLTYDYDQAGKDDDQWLYLPALRKTKRIASSDKSGSFMGSDFNFSDMSEPDLDKYEFKLMKEPKVNGFPTWQIQSIPKSKEEAKDSGYSKSVLWVRKDIHMVIRSVRWVHKSRRLKYMQIVELEHIDGIWVAAKMKMTTKEGRKTVHTTLLQFDNIQFNQGLKESMFTVRTLEKGVR